MALIRIAVDAMGGDNAPGAVIRGVIDSLKGSEGVEVILVGPRGILEEGLRGGVTDTLPIRIADAPEVIGPEEQPVQAIQKKKHSSIVIGVGMLKEGLADAFVSAGNTGALMAAGLLICGRVPGVKRPAIGGILPTIDGRGVLVLDLGAHMDATPVNLYQYAVMGSIYAEKVMGVANPSIGLLNVGTEENKGNEVVKEAYNLLSSGSVRFAGNVEARDIFNRIADVVVCDGFVGNILLKALEGFGQGVLQLLKKGLDQESLSRISPLLSLLDYRQYGGSPILGIDGVCIKCHGSSDSTAIRHGIRIAKSVVAQNVVGTIRAQLASEPELIKVSSEGGAGGS